MKKKITALLVSLMLSGAALAGSTISAEKMWNKTFPLMQKGVEIYTTEDNPEGRDWSRVLTFRDSRIQNIIEDVLEVLGTSVITDDLHEVEKTSSKIRQLRSEIKQLRGKMIGAPAESNNPFATTRQSLRKDISKDESLIARHQASLEQLKQRAKDNVRRMNLNISPETIDYLCVAPNGSTIAQLMSVSMNIKQLIEYVEQQIGTSGADDAQIAHTYAGLYFIGCRTQVEAYDLAAKEIDTVYQPRLSKLYADAKKLIAETQKMIHESDPATQRTLKGNLATTQRAVTLMDAYGKYLSRQKANLARDREGAAKRLKVAVNTLKTVSISAKVIGLVRSSVKDLDSVFAFQLPEQKWLNDVYRDDFNNLMEMLKSK